MTGGLKILEQIAKLTGSRKMTSEKAQSNPWKLSAVACGSKHSLALTQGGSVWVWGDVRRGALGLGEETRDHLYPMALHSLSQKTIRFIASGSEHCLAIAATGEVYTWGNGRSGQLGNGFLGFGYTPILVQALDGKGAFSGACGEDYTGVLTEIGEVYMFGSSDSGKLGLGVGPPQVFPKLIPSLTGVKKLSAGLSHTAALTDDGLIFTWGGGFYGRLGHRSPDNYYQPSQLSSRIDRQYIDVSCGAYHTLALDSNGRVLACGKGELVCSDQDLMQITTLEVFGDKTFAKVCAAEEHSLAVSKDGEVYVWGKNRYGKLGNKTETEDQPTPYRLLGLPLDITQISCYTNHTLVLTKTGDIYSWGCGGSGRLGYGDTTNVLYPKRMETRWTAVNDRDDEDREEDEINATELLISLLDSGSQITSFKEMMLVLGGEERQNIESAIVARETEITNQLTDIVKFISSLKGKQEEVEDLKAQIEAKVMQRSYELRIPPRDYLRVLIPRFLAQNLVIYEEIVWALQQQPCYLARLIRTMRRKGAKDIPRVIRSLRFIFSNINTKGKFLHVDKNADSLLYLGLCRQVFAGEIETASRLNDLFADASSPAVEMLLTFFSREAGSELLFKMFQRPLQNFLEMVTALGDEGLIIDPLELAKAHKSNSPLDSALSDKKLKAILKERLLYFLKGVGYFLDTIKSTPAHLPPPVKILLKYAYESIAQRVWLQEVHVSKSEESKLYLQAILRLFVLNVFVPVIRAPEQEGLFVDQISEKQRQALILVCDAIRKIVEKSTYIGEIYTSVNVFMAGAHTHLLEAMEASFEVEDSSEVDLVVTTLMQHFDYAETYVHFNVNELVFLVLTLIKYRANVQLKTGDNDYLYSLIDRLGNVGEEVIISEENYKVNLKLKTKFLLEDTDLVTCKFCETPMPRYLAVTDNRPSFIRQLTATEPDSPLLALEEACRHLPKFTAYSLAEVESKLKAIIDGQIATNAPNYDLVFLTRKAQEKVTELINRDISLESVLSDISRRFKARKSQGFYLRRISEGVQALNNAKDLYLDFCRTQIGDLETALSNISTFRLNVRPTEKELKQLTQAKLLGLHLKNLQHRNVQHLPNEVKHDIVGSVAVRDLERFAILEQLTASYNLSQKKSMELHYSHSRNNGWHFELIYKNRAGQDLLGQFNMTNEQYLDLKRIANSEATTEIPGLGRFRTGPLVIFLNSKIRVLTV